ncbi:MAG: cell wall-binding repeat-containing protein [Coriobacteriia bacterium]|nr:cell wall-binding repeat-containing protein [Coriobacteriia bacterium]
MNGPSIVRRVLIVAVALALAAQPLVAFAAWQTPGSWAGALTARGSLTAKPVAEPLPVAAGPAAQAFSAPEDAYEAAGDDTWNAAGVRNITSKFMSLELPGVAYVESHTLDKADADGADEDWLKFDFKASDREFPFSLLIEAVGKTPDVDPVIEVFGPGDPVLTPYAELPSFDGELSDVTAPDPNSIAWGMRDSWFAGRGASAAVMFSSGSAPGRYYIRVRPYYQGPGGGGFAGGGAGAYELRLKAGTALRLAGPDRYRTSTAISREMFAKGALKGGACVVANGLDFPDALAGSTLAGAVGGPLLLTGPNSLEGSVEAEIKRLGVSTVYVLGGTPALSRAVFNRIDGIPNVRAVRVAGRDRYATAREIAKKAYQLAGGGPRTAFVASGVNFPDALSASPMAAYNGAPVLLTRPDALSTAAEGAIKDLGITDVIVVGGEPAVSKAVHTRLTKLLNGTSHVRRIGGKNRYQTSASFAKWATTISGAYNGGRVGTPANPNDLWALYPAQSGVASGLKFPDALAGGIAAGLAGCPLVLLDESDAALTAYVGYLDAVGQPQTKTYVYGGEATMSEVVMAVVDILTFPAFWEEIF